MAADGTWLIFPNAPQASVDNTAYLRSPEARKRLAGTSIFGGRV